MKPLNLNKETCNPISSNCVIWQGPDLPCIKLCKGDTVSDVVAKLATELCAILDMLNVENYDLSCFNITACGPQNFQQLIQFLIDQICALQNVEPPAPPTTGCPDCLVTVNQDCFSELGEVVQLVDYVTAIAAKICTLVLQVSALQNAVLLLDGRVTILEGYFPLPAPTEPEIIPQACLGLPLVLTPISTVLDTLSTEFCDLLSATGTSTEIIAAYISQCVNSTDDALVSQYSAPGTQMGTEYPTYVVAPSSLADAITNLWLAICDTRNAGKQLTELAAGTNTIISSTTVSVVGNDQVTTYAIDTVIDVQNEGTTLTTVPQSINFVGDLVDATAVGDDVTVTISTFGAMAAQSTPTNLSSVAFGLGNELCAQSNQIISQIYDDDNAYDPVTGIWTCPATGRYNLSCYVHYTNNIGDGWYDSLNPGGMFGVGIFSSIGCVTYCANWMTVMGIQKNIDISAQAAGYVITAGTQLSVKVLNQTGYSYTSTLGDVIRFSIERVK